MTDQSWTVLLRIEMPPLDARCRAAIDAGFQGVELSLHSTGGDRDNAALLPILPPETTRSVIGAVSAICRVCPMDLAVEQVARLLNDASRYGARCLNLSIEPPADGINSGQRSSQDVLNFLHRLMCDVRFEAESAGVALALEAGAQARLLSALALREVIDAANSWAVGVCVDVDRLATRSDPVEWIETLHRRIHSVRLSAAAGESGSSSRKDRFGIPAIGRALQRIGYDRILIAAGIGEPVAWKGALDALQDPGIAPWRAAGQR